MSLAETRAAFADQASVSLPAFSAYAPSPLGMSR